MVIYWIGLSCSTQYVLLLFSCYCRCCEVPAVSHTLTRLHTACLNFSHRNDCCSVLPAAAENSVLPGKISSVFHFHPHISFNIHCKHPIHSLTTPLCYWLQRRRGAQSSLVMNRWWAGTLTGEKCPAFGLFCDNSAGIEGAAGAVQESCGVRPGTTRPVLLRDGTKSLHRPKPACP